MSHRATGGVSGQIPGEIDTRLTFWHKYLMNIDKRVSKRVGMSLEDYRKLTFSEYWVSGEEAVSSKMSDLTVLARCDKSLNGTYNQEVQTFFGPVQVTWSKCPLNTTPLKIDFSGVERYENRPEDVKMVKEVIFELLGNNKLLINKDFLKSEKYNKVMR